MLHAFTTPSGKLKLMLGSSSIMACLHFNIHKLDESCWDLVHCSYSLLTASSMAGNVRPLGLRRHLCKMGCQSAALNQPFMTFLSSLLQLNPCNRASAHEALQVSFCSYMLKHVQDSSGTQPIHMRAVQGLMP